MAGAAAEHRLAPAAVGIGAYHQKVRLLFAFINRLTSTSNPCVRSTLKAGMTRTAQRPIASFTRPPRTKSSTGDHGGKAFCRTQFVRLFRQTVHGQATGANWLRLGRADLSEIVLRAWRACRNAEVAPPCSQLFTFRGTDKRPACFVKKEVPTQVHANDRPIHAFSFARRKCCFLWRQSGAYP